MSRILDYSHNVSLRLSQVMDEIGVNKKIVMKRRKSMLLRESLQTLTDQLMDKDTKTYFFGSQMEGTTTIGLYSDSDCLGTISNVDVIQDWNEWEYGKRKLLMIQDESVSPGYCYLQVLRDDAPLPAVDGVNQHLFRDERGRILFKNTLLNVSVNNESVRHGPSQSRQGGPGILDVDYVAAFTCQTYPVQARQWLDQQNEGHWPSNDMIQFCCTTGCFVVGVGNKGSENEELEWRISTSLAERCLMFNLNITQIRCYVLMKMILKTFITSQYPECISSFMCKTVLLHCISNTTAEEWKEISLLTCLTFCLSTLYNCVLNEYCPHFLIPENNLMFRRFSQEHKPFILASLHHVIESNGRSLLEIKCDKFGLRFQCSLNGIIVRDIRHNSTNIAGLLLMETALNINDCLTDLLCTMKNLSSKNAERMMSSIISTFINTQNTHLDCKCLIAQQLCLVFGSILASSNIERRHNLTYKALSFMLLGVNSDVASGKLKLASVFYCIEDTVKTELILKDIEENYDLSVVEPMCKCHDFKPLSRRQRLNILYYESNQECRLIKDITASCVVFLRCEMHCCPHELRHEMFRSTQEDILYRNEYNDWMDMAVMDSLTYLYFLQYKTFSRLGKEEVKRRALSNLIKTIEIEPNLGHKETALNLLGQCMEQENRNETALKCYMLSLNARGRNNAAKVLICRLLSSAINARKNDFCPFNQC